MKIVIYLLHFSEIIYSDLQLEVFISIFIGQIILYSYFILTFVFHFSRLELNGHRRRLTWEATPRSIHEGIASAILSSDCLVFDTSIVQLFEDNGNLGINVTISMV